MPIQMTPDDMFSADNQRGIELADQPDLKERWTQARGQLLGFAHHLAHYNAEITADQLQLAIALADRYMQPSRRIYESMTRVVLGDMLVVRVWRAEKELLRCYDNSDIVTACRRFDQKADCRLLVAEIEKLGRINAIEIVDRLGNGGLVYPDWP